MRIKATEPPLLAIFFAFLAGGHCFAQQEVGQEVIVSQFPQLLLKDTGQRETAFLSIQKNWREDFLPMMLEVLNLNGDGAFNARLIPLLERKTGQLHGYDLDRWYRWLWSREPNHHPLYADFKSALYRLIDPKFEHYFDSERTAKIRLDEVRWGGVQQDGIPPLRDPKMILASEAHYLDGGDVVFGLAVKGVVRAYPKRILAWHEMFIDQVGGVPVAGVYCTLCGTMILYKTVYQGVHHQLGTSGFLYRSNKLMYDRATQSLWNTIWGQPVIGPLADRDITLERLSVVTTTWSEWRKRHPESMVLSLDTGHQRDYSEGAAYREYFATDDLMFEVPKLDKRLKNKDEVLGLLLAEYAEQPLAISAKYLANNPVYQDRIGNLEFVVLTDQSGANRVYEAKGIRFESWDLDRTVIDRDGVRWTLSEARLESPEGRQLFRLPAHRAFWFGWFSAYSHTRLVK